MKPSPDNIQELYLQSLAALGIHAEDHDIRFVEDNWESPTLGAWGLGWEVWLDGMEVTQFTYFQQVGSIDCKPVSVEITYGLERLAMYIQGVEKDVYKRQATGKQYLEGYTDNEAEYKALLEAGVAFGKAFKLTPGIALSKEQMKAITTDMAVSYTHLACL